MDFIKFSIHNPVTVIVGVILVTLFGLVSLGKLPYQLSPRVEQPVVSVMTFWPGATPYEVERDIVEEQENVLKGVENLIEMESESQDNSGRITLRFKLGTDLEDALLAVSNKLNQVASYPENVFKPILAASGIEQSGAVMLSLQTLPGNPANIYEYLTYFENNIRQYLERVPGVAEVQARGGIQRQMQVLVKHEKLAAYGLTIDQVIGALRGDNVNVSSGSLGVGRRDIRIRAVSEFRSAEDIASVTVFTDGQRSVHIGDLADVEFGYSKLQGVGYQDGKPGIVLSIVAEPDANVLEVTDAVEEATLRLNEEVLKKDELELVWINDQKMYINGAIKNLNENIVIGGLISVVVLLVFLRSFAATIIVTTTIPISIVGTFIFMQLLGTTLNVVSLAGIAFAVGMLVDNAIVVLENIDRHRQMGKSPVAAAYDGTREVWGAVLASTLTNVAVFLPVVFLEQEAGLLFRDIAIAVTCAVLISLVASVSVIPMLSRKLFEFSLIHHFERKVSRRHALVSLGGYLERGIMSLVKLAMRNAFTRLTTAAVMMGTAVIVTMSLFPSMEYLPEGSRDLIFNNMMGPPGLSYEERKAIGEYAYNYLEPYYEPGYKGYPGLRRTFFMSNGDYMNMGMVSADPQRTRELIPLAQELSATIPGVQGFANQASIFGRGMSGGRSVEVNLNGADIDAMIAASAHMMGVIRERMPEAQIRPRPSLDLLYPEARYEPSSASLRAVGMTAQQFGIALDVLMDGRDIGDFKQEGEKKIDLVVKMAGTDIESPEQLHNALIPVPGGRIVPVSSLASLRRTTGLTSIRHLERNRVFSLQITPPYSITLEDAMNLINDEIVTQMQKEGRLEGITITMTGTADKLAATRDALQWNFLLAVAITYLLMAALFGNFIYPFIILLTVPLAGAGGFIGLRLVNLYLAPQALDVITMLGFIILVGIVVNNAILIVHQSLNNIRIGHMPHREAVVEATRSRLRPIYMTATTAVFGMLPLVLRPGAGSELYRGLGSVILGGLAVSTIFTVFLIPALLMFCIRMEKIPTIDVEGVKFSEFPGESEEKERELVAAK